MRSHNISHATVHAICTMRLDNINCQLPTIFSHKKSMNQIVCQDVCNNTYYARRTETIKTARLVTQSTIHKEAGLKPIDNAGQNTCAGSLIIQSGMRWSVETRGACVCLSK